MIRGARRRTALWLSVFFLFQSAGALQLLAANGSVRGRLTIEGGSPPPGALIRATPLDGGAPATSPLATDLSYQFPALKEGAYLFEIIDASGHALAPGVKTLVPPGVLQLNLRVKLQAAPPVSTPESSPQEPVPARPGTPPPVKPPAPPAPGTATGAPAEKPARTGGGASRKTRWTVVGVVLGGLGVGLAAGNNGNDNSGSPSQP